MESLWLLEVIELHIAQLDTIHSTVTGMWLFIWPQDNGWILYFVYLNLTDLLNPLTFLVNDH